MDFVGFSSDEEDECDPFPLIPPDRKQNLTVFEETNMSSSSNQEGIYFIQPESPVQDVPVSHTPSSDPVKDSPSVPIKGRGGDRGGGRSKAFLPGGCKVTESEQGGEAFVCHCQATFKEKKNLLRHQEDYCRNKSPIGQLNSKRKRSESTEELDDVTGDNEAITVMFKEDPEGSSLLECKSNKSC